MGRKSRAKKSRIRVGDTIKIIRDGDFVCAGHYLVTGIDKQCVSYSVGDNRGRILRTCLPSFKRLTVEEARSIDWRLEQKKYQRAFNELLSKGNWEKEHIDTGFPFVTLHIAKPSKSPAAH